MKTRWLRRGFISGAASDGRQTEKQVANIKQGSERHGGRTNTRCLRDTESHIL